MKFLEKLNLFYEKQILPKKYYLIMKEFYFSYLKACSIPKKKIENLFLSFLDLLKDQLTNPFIFSYYHKKIRSPFDYYLFGINFLNPLINKKKSKLLGTKNLKKIEKQLNKKENIILFANHQSECDPQAISILLGKRFEKIAIQIIYVAGDRVITDPLAIPLSMGCDLLCIYSKKYINTPAEKKLEKQMHNKKTMQIMQELLKEGNKIIYVAPSGGRDRPNEKKELKISPFDPQSIEMFYLMAKIAKTKTHFYPLALFTYNLMPPPDNIQIEMGEKRVVKEGKIHAFFGKEINMEKFVSKSTFQNKKQLRQKRAIYIQKLVEDGFETLKKL